MTRRLAQFAVLLLALLAPAWLTVAAAPAAAQAAIAYQLGPLDQIEVNVANFPDLKTTTRIGVDGGVVLPLVGMVRLGGQSLAQAAGTIERAYAAGGYVKTPSVRVEITDYQSRKASVLGQVNTQGMVVLDRPYSVAEIIARAGGLSRDAAESAIIVRQKPDGSGSERHTIDLSELSGGNGNGAMTQVRADDAIFVPRAATYSVTGAVVRAGNYRWLRGMTVQQALAEAGDLGVMGTLSGLKIRRQIAGAATIVPVTVDDPVQPGDVLVVRERLF